MGVVGVGVEERWGFLRRREMGLKWLYSYYTCTCLLGIILKGVKDIYTNESNY